MVPPREADGTRVLDVAIVGGGMAGLAASAELRLLGIDNQCVIDRAPAGYEARGSRSRGWTLRSPKQLAPALGLPALTFRAWFEAQAATRGTRSTRFRARNGWTTCAGTGACSTCRCATTPRSSRCARATTACSRSTCAATAKRRRCSRGTWCSPPARRLGGPYVPPSRNARRARFVRADRFRGARGQASRRGRRGASAFDNAGTALEAGAARVDLFFRRTDIPRINKLTGIGSPGLVHGYADLDDATKWRFMHYALTSRTPPPRDSVLRVSRHEHAHFHAGSPIETLAEHADGLDVTTPRGRYTVDFLIFATGFHSDWTTRAEFASFGAQVRRWKDRYRPEPGTWIDELAESPDLGPRSRSRSAAAHVRPSREFTASTMRRA